VGSSARELVKTLLQRDVSFECDEYSLPSQIELLKLNKVGPFKKFEAYFHRDTVNVVYGPGGSGKSTILRSILHAFGVRHKYFNTQGSIQVKTFPDHGQCLLVDNLLGSMPTRTVAPLLKELNQLGVQVIVTARAPQLDKTTLEANADVISLEYPHYR